MSTIETGYENLESYLDYSPDYNPEYSGEYYPEAGPSRGRPYNAPQQPKPGGAGYTRSPTMPTSVTQEQLRQALARVKQDIDQVANGVRANNANLNDFAGRTTRNLNRVRDENKREIARLDQAVAGARDLGVLGAVLAAGDNKDVILPLIVVAMDQQSQSAAPAGGAAAGGLLGGGNTGLVLALAVSGMLK